MQITYSIEVETMDVRCTNAVVDYAKTHPAAALPVGNPAPKGYHRWLALRFIAKHGNRSGGNYVSFTQCLKYDDKQ